MGVAEAAKHAFIVRNESVFFPSIDNTDACERLVIDRCMCLADTYKPSLQSLFENILSFSQTGTLTGCQLTATFVYPTNGEGALQHQLTSPLEDPER